MESHRPAAALRRDQDRELAFQVWFERPALPPALLEL